MKLIVDIRHEILISAHSEYYKNSSISSHKCLHFHNCFQIYFVEMRTFATALTNSTIIYVK